MKLKLVASLSVLIFSACYDHESAKNTAQYNLKDDDIDRSIHESSNGIQVNGQFQVSNQLINNEVQIIAYETNQLKDGAYYFLIVLKNNGHKPFTLQMEQIVLIDQYGNEYNAGLVGYELLGKVEPYATVSGIIGFEGEKNMIPTNLKFKKIIE
ncbi:DUF4352 domain-containing protein [Acinetobacter sp. ANC 4558]|uniref:DUF4352 domain-containing protein n=1 Tax=Acinetobacter sp. ANC 4558 TaxID=1977876 RepID=UPI00111BFEA3|nr:DUF4352 domain-containing protein [Acinetobacter sp. ANC 4558]